MRDWYEGKPFAFGSLMCVVGSIHKILFVTCRWEERRPPRQPVKASMERVKDGSRCLGVLFDDDRRRTLFL